MSQESRLDLLKDRALMLKQVRSFFDEKNVMEVDPPCVLKHPSIDEYIESIQLNPNQNEIGYLHTSPEYMMKRLLSEKIGDIYFLGHVFRKNEIGKNHNLEFTMIEWYRQNVDFDFFIDEVIDLINLFTDVKKIKKICYKDLFFEFLNIDINKTNISDLSIHVKNYNIESDISNFKKDDYLNFLMSEIEKKLDRDILYVVYDYPKTQASLARTYIKDNIEVAKRFEFFYKGIELGNGFHELNDAKKQRKRFENIIQKKKNLTLDNKFLDALENGIGNCFGIAIGFDRLMLLRHNKQDIHDILSFSWKSV